MDSSSGFARSARWARTVRRAACVDRAALGALVGFACASSLVACRPAAAAPPPAASCAQYPIPWHPAAGTEAAASAELASFAPGAQMSWNASTGTLSSVLQLAAPLPGCTDGQDVGGQVLAAITAHPALFQLDPSEWRAPEPFDCRYLTGDTTISIGRSQLAGHPVAEDVFVAWLTRVKDVVQLSSVTGVYLPVVGGAMPDAMTACNVVTEADAIAGARKTPLSASVYAQCQRTGTVSYTAKASDHFSLAPREAWTWQADAGQALLTGQRTLRVTVDPANYTPALIDSGARCPTPDGEGFTIGFELTLDVHTGEIVGVKPGLDCVVC